MNRTPSNPGQIRRPQSEHGIALILTLSILVLVTLLVIAFAVSMRVEQTASANFNDLIRARQIAQGAVDQAVAQLRAATPVPVDNPPSAVSTYQTGPGYAFQNSTGSFTSNELCSAAAGTDTNNLNSGFLITGQDGTFNDPSTAAMAVNWVYIGQDGSISPQPIASGSPVAGRFAYWVDDEACKININSAGVPTSTDPTYGADSAPWDVDLSQLNSPLSANAHNIFLQRTSAGTPYPFPYATPQEVLRAYSPSAYADYTANQFDITTYSNDTGDLDVFGRPRRALSGPAGPGVLSNYWDIVITTMNGAYGRLSDPGLQNIYSTQAPYPTFLEKYANNVTAFGGGTLNGLGQLIANIIAYQTTNAPPPDSGGIVPTYLGLARVPYINELQISYTQSAGTIARKVVVELNYLYSADANYVVPAGSYIYLTNLPIIVGTTFTQYGTLTVTAGDTYQSGSQYHAYSFSDSAPTPVTAPNPTLPATPTAQPVVANLYVPFPGNTTPARVDCAQIPLSAVPVSFPIPTGPPALTQGAEVNDPCLNEIPTEWTPYIFPSQGTLGGPNSVVKLPSNTDLSKVHIRGTPMLSVGELGFIHTPYYANNPAGSADWQYLRLQPQPMAERSKNMIPDWAILDIFTASNAESEVQSQSPIQGRININSGMSIFANNTTVERGIPLLALLNAAIPTGSSVDAPTLGQYIISRLPYANNYPTGDPFGNPNAYDTIGEICEVQGMDAGATTQAGKEAIIRRIANLITVRSNAFTIWAVGQSIKKVPASASDPTHYRADLGDFISGESKLQVVVERVVDSSGNVEFRTLYSRYINQ